MEDRPRVVTRTGEVLETTRTGPRGTNGAASPFAPRRYAPPTHAFIGAFEQAGFGLRYGAWMFDFLITLIAMLVFTFAITALSHRSVVGSNKDLIFVTGLTLLMFLLNFVVLAGTGGQSAGMRILGIYIMRVDGQPFSMKHAAIRHLIGYPLSTVLFFLGFLWMLWDPRQQAWHDKLAGTIVVIAK
ncbi:MAG TPA: RDD family protein [Blastocatellia bacterium]|nr:RDD family protein [Blastocatellia bacterium]